MVSSVHWGKPSSMGMAAVSMALQTSGFVLDFLLVKFSTQQGGHSSKKSTFSGISVSFSQRACSSPAMAHRSKSPLTLWRMYGSATLAKSSGDMERRYTALK